MGKLFVSALLLILLPHSRRTMPSASSLRAVPASARHMAIRCQMQNNRRNLAANRRTTLREKWPIRSFQPCILGLLCAWQLTREFGSLIK